MPTGRPTMRRIRDLLRLKVAQGLSERAIATSLGLGKGSVGGYLPLLGDIRDQGSVFRNPSVHGVQPDDRDLAVGDPNGHIASRAPHSGKAAFDDEIPF